jgi:hypothetical protein
MMIHLEGFLPLPSEGYKISKAQTSSMTDLPLLRKFPLCIPSFYLMFDVLAHILIFGSIHPLHASSIYVLCLIAPHPFPTAFPSCVFLFSLLMCTHPSVLSIWRVIC